MTERSIINARKIPFRLVSLRQLLILGDLGSALIIAWIVRRLLPALPGPDHVLQIWLLAVVMVWVITADIDKSFRLDAVLTYTRVLKIIWWAAVGYLLFFVTTREPYSLTFLLWASLSWGILAIGWRWVLSKLASPARGLAFETLPAALRNSHKVQWNIVTDPKQINLAEFDFLLIDFNKQYPEECQELFTHAHIVGLPIMSKPQIVEHLFGKISIEHFSNFWVEATFYIDPLYLRAKRFIDLAITIMVLPVLLPLCAIVALLVLLFMGRPILFWQERMGWGNESFNMVKFRTMINDTEKTGSGSTAKNDARVTRFGAILRKLRLDELPQFYNVFKGEMSIIGPRPEHVVLVEDFVKNIPLFQARHWLRPGITGWAQVMHGYAHAANQDEMMEKIRYDMFYLKNLSLWLDLIIIFRTIMTVLTGFGSR